MVDIHTHILPCIDDGSQSVDETLEILAIMAQSGVKKVVATPHFYSEVTSVDDFLKRRNEAYEKIKDKKPEEIEVVLGAEVFLDYDLHKADMRSLAIGDTDYILIEMPYSRWDPWVFDELFKISAKHNLEIIIAHLDRYVNMIKGEDIQSLIQMRLKYQANINFLGSFLRKSNAINLMRNGIIHFVGSDCHNLTSRPPCLASSMEKIRARLGEDYVKHYMSNADKMLRNESL